MIKDLIVYNRQFFYNNFSKTTKGKTEVISHRSVLHVKL